MSLHQAQWPVRQLGHAASHDDPPGPARLPAITLIFVHGESAAPLSWQLHLSPVNRFADLASEIGSQRPDLVLVAYETLIQASGMPRESDTIAAQLAAIRCADRQLPVIVMVPSGEDYSEAIMQAIGAGASDVAADAISPEDLREKIVLLAQRRRLQRRPAMRQHPPAARDEQLGAPPHHRIVGVCGAVVANLAAVARAAAGRDPILICGEPGTGKSLFAQTLHRYGSIAGDRSRVIDCAQCTPEFVDEQLLEQYDGAFQPHRELGSAAVIIENVDHASPRTQRRLLAAIRRQPLPAERERPEERNPPAAPRLVMTCGASGGNVPLHHTGATASERPGLIAELYFELSGQMIQLPPLRTRGSDIGLLIDHFIRLFTGTTPVDHSDPDHRITAEAKQVLMAYDWPGNVAQLRSVISAELQQGDGTIVLSDRFRWLRPHRPHRPHRPQQTAAAIADDQPSTVTEINGDVPVHLSNLSSAGAWSTIVKAYDDPAAAAGDGASLYAEAIQAAEAGLITSVLENTGGNLTQAARLLGITRVSLRRKINSLGLQIPGRP